ncbi:MAG: hypothetical protein AAF573_01200 [Bacteroidota bacterium]
MLRHTLYIFLLLVISWSGCTSADEVVEENDVELAKVFSKKLFLSELEGMVPEGSTPEDSTKIIRAEVERWVRETLLMQEAEKSLPPDLNIDELVRDYRSSLIRHNYEQFLVETQLDSLVTPQQLNDYYEKNKEHHQLQSSIVRCWLIKIPKSDSKIPDLRNWWNSNAADDFQNLKDYATQNATLYMLEDSIWYQINDVKAHLPSGINLTSKQKQSPSDNDFQYFFKVLERISPKQIAPLAYIQDQVKKVILHKRKMVLLDQRKEELYDRETSKKNVKIFTK